MLPRFQFWLHLGMLLTFFLGPQPPVDDKLRGTVRAEDNRPIEGVDVQGAEGKCCPFKRSSTKTNADGTFVLPSPNGIVYFRKDGYGPQARLLSHGETEVEITLKDAKETNWNVPSCSSATRLQPRIGAQLKFEVPNGSKVRKGSDIDYVYWNIRSPEKSRWLTIMSGPLVGGGQVFDELVRDAADYRERWMVGGGGHWFGMDMRGRSSNGLYFRSAGIWSVAISYAGVSKESAQFFDKIIDLACVDFNQTK